MYPKNGEGKCMNNLTKKQKQAILDSFGKLVIEEIRDGALRI